MTISNSALKGEIITIQIAIAALITLHPDQERITAAIRQMTSNLLANIPQPEAEDYAIGIRASLETITASPL